jgi:hypothetical protein
VLELFEKN